MLEDQPSGPIVVHVESVMRRPGCAECGVVAWITDRPAVVLVDLPCFGRPTRLVWHKHRRRCPDPDCEVASWTAEDPVSAAPAWP